MGRSLRVAMALLLLSSTASAQTVTERLRIQAGYLTQAPPKPQPRIEDAFVGAVPELALYWPGRASLFSITYSLTGALHTLGGASEIANRLVLASLFDLSPRTTLLLNAEAAQTTFSNLLIQRPAADTSLALYPGTATRLLSARVLQGINHELSSRWRFEQNAEGGVVTALSPSPPLDTFIAGLGAAVEHIWRNDAAGFETRAYYVRSIAVAPTPDQEVVTLTAGPRWRHDWSRSLSSSAAAGVSVAISPRTDADPILAPFGRAALLYLINESTIDLSYSTGIFPSPLTGQVIRSHQATLRGFTPISLRHQVFAGASIGYLHSDVVDLTPLNNDQTFDTALADLDLTWQVSSRVGMFARYQFAAQYGEANAVGANPSFLRDLFLVGVQFSSRPTGADMVPTRFPQRVDRGDQPARQ